MNTVFSNLMYSLKRQFGTCIDYVQLETSVANYHTGSRSIGRKVFPLPAVQMPESVMRKFIQDIGYLAANKNFTYGGLLDLADVAFVLNPEDLPPEFDRSVTGYVHWKGQRYEKVDFEYLLDSAILLKVRGVKGSVPYAEVRATSQSTVQFAGRATYELN